MTMMTGMMMMMTDMQGTMMMMTMTMMRGMALPVSAVSGGWVLQMLVLVMQLQMMRGMRPWLPAQSAELAPAAQRTTKTHSSDTSQQKGVAKKSEKNV